MENESKMSMELLDGATRLWCSALLVAFVSVLAVPQTGFSNASATLFGIVFDINSNTEQLVSIDPSSGTLTPIGSGVANCCVIGTQSALDPNNGVFYFVGRTFSESSWRLFAFDTQTGAVLSSPVIPHAISVCVNFLEFQSTSPAKPVAIDIKPGSLPNSVNPKSKGVIPVAILTTDTFDAASVDPATVRFGKTGTEAPPVHSALEDVDGDRDTDLIFHFNTQATGIQCGDTSASLTGKTFDGQMIEGADSIKTAGCKY